MKSLKKRIVVLFLLVSSLFLQAQETITTSGGNASGSGGSASYSIGQVAYTYQESLNGNASQGVQQPYEISIVLQAEEANGITLQFTVFPNPTTSNIILKIENYSIENLEYSIFDINGKTISNENITSNETFISMENLAEATYFIRVMKYNKEFKTFKIIKKQ